MTELTAFGKRLCNSLGQPYGGSMVSDPPIDGFKKGWCKIPFHGDKGHCFRVVTTGNITRIAKALAPDIAKRAIEYKSLCGINAESTHKPLGIGNFPKCKRCESVLKKLPVKTQREYG